MTPDPLMDALQALVENCDVTQAQLALLIDRQVDMQRENREISAGIFKLLKTVAEDLRVLRDQGVFCFQNKCQEPVILKRRKPK